MHPAAPPDRSVVLDWGKSSVHPKEAHSILQQQTGLIDKLLTNNRVEPGEELVEIDIQVLVHRYRPDRGFEEKPWVKTQIELPVSFDTFRLSGFMPRGDVDLSGDGMPDFVSSGGGDAIEISLGRGQDTFSRRPYRQQLSTSGVIRFGDLDGDGLLDFAIYDPHDFDSPVRVGRNLGRLPEAD